MMGRLSTVVLEQTLEQVCLWQTMGLGDFCVSVNVSPMQLRAESLVTDTIKALEKRVCLASVWR